MTLDCLGSLLELHEHLKRGCHMHSMKVVVRQPGTIWWRKHCQPKWDSFITLYMCVIYTQTFMLDKK